MRQNRPTFAAGFPPESPSGEVTALESLQCSPDHLAGNKTEWGREGKGREREERKEKEKG